MDVFIGTILLVPFDFAPDGWALCNGQTLKVSENQTLFSLIEYRYGGDGKTTFALPDLRGRVVIGTNPDSPNPIPLGEKGGASSATVICSGEASLKITAANMPVHKHAATADVSGLAASTDLNVNTSAGGLIPTNGSYLSQGGSSGNAAAIFSTTLTSPVKLGGIATKISGAVSVSVQESGDGQPTKIPLTAQGNVSLMQPYLGLNYIIALEGEFPTRPQR